MAFVFYVIGGLVVTIGAFWSVLVVLSASQMPQPGSGMAIFAALLAAMPGLGTVLSGLLLLAIGSGLGKLDQIIENTSGLLQGAREPVDTSRWSRSDRERFEAREPELR